MGWRPSNGVRYHRYTLIKTIFYFVSSKISIASHPIIFKLLFHIRMWSITSTCIHKHHLTTTMAPCIGFEPTSPFRPTVFKTAPSPPGHTALMEQMTGIEPASPPWQGGIRTIELHLQMG